jgi:hypothetical protein
VELEQIPEGETGSAVFLLTCEPRCEGRYDAPPLEAYPLPEAGGSLALVLGLGLLVWLRRR